MSKLYLREWNTESNDDNDNPTREQYLFLESIINYTIKNWNNNMTQ